MHGSILFRYWHHDKIIITGLVRKMKHNLGEMEEKINFHLQIGITMNSGKRHDNTRNHTRITAAHNTQKQQTIISLW